MRLKKLGPWMAMLILLGWASLFSQTIRVTGSWALSIDSSNLPGPGSDLPDSFESDPDQIEIDVHGQKLEDYQVTIQRSDVSWNPYFRVYARRTSDGTGSGYISGGTNYVEASTTSQEFFRGGKKSLQYCNSAQTQWSDCGSGIWNLYHPCGLYDYPVIISQRLKFYLIFLFLVDKIK